VADAPAECWFIQSRSDLAAGAKVFDKSDATTYCQAIAKYQQAVEKSIKGLVAGFKNAGILSCDLQNVHDVQKPMRVLMNLPRKADNKDIQNKIRGLLFENRRNVIATLCALAPKGHKPVRRNTEYPFQKTDESWLAPAEVGAFAIEETARFSSLARKIVGDAPRIVRALRRAPKTSSTKFPNKHRRR